jgi:hypothetical protein
MPSREFAAGLISGIDRLIRQANEVDINLAKELLDSTLNDYPRPAWNTGELRSSGAVYIGGQLIKQNPWVGANPVGAYATMENAGMATPGNSNVVGELRIRKLRQGTTGDNVSSLRGKITVIYDSPVAAMMHEWNGGFSDDESGPHYISAKLLKFGPRFQEVLREIFR